MGCLIINFTHLFFNILVVLGEKPKLVRNNIKSKAAKPMVLYGAYMGNLVHDYDYLELTIESMRWNPQIDFVLLNVVENADTDAKGVLDIKRRLNVRNFHPTILSVKDYVSRVKQRLGIDIMMNYTNREVSGRKLNDFKLVFAHLFPEHIKPDHRFWGYIDYDVIWGNFNAYADWFNGDYFAVFANVFIPAGFLTVIKLGEPWSLDFAFRNDTLFLQLLKNQSHHCLDEDSSMADSGQDSFFYDQSMISKMSDIETASQGALKIKRLSLDEFHIQPYSDPYKTMNGNWGPVRWFQGALHVVLGSFSTAPERELLLFHRPLKERFLLDVPEPFRRRVTKDFIKYGYFLPNFVPIHTRYVCRDLPYLQNLSDYKPFRCGQTPLNSVKIVSTK